MRYYAKAVLSAALGMTAAGCDGGSSSLVTDPSKLPPASAADIQEVRQTDDQIAEEENSNPTKPTKGKAK